MLKDKLPCVAEATEGKVAYLRGFKENVIMGQIIPAGTGYTTAPQVGPEAVGRTHPNGTRRDEPDRTAADGLAKVGRAAKKLTTKCRSQERPFLLP
jgi:hypothetical protein